MRKTCSRCSELGNIYTRIMNPTCDVAGEAHGGSGGRRRRAGAGVGAGGVDVLPCSISARPATISSVRPICTAAPGTCSPTRCARLGIEVRFVDPADPEAFARATDDRTRCYYAETLPNPKLHVFPIREVAEIGRRFGVPLIVDNTAAPIICRPLDHGAADRHVFDHQVHRRPRHLDRRAGGRRRQLRLGRRTRQRFPTPEPAGSQLSRRRLDRKPRSRWGRSPTSCACG